MIGRRESEIKSAEAAIGTSARGKRGDLADLRDFDRLQTIKDDKDPSTPSSPTPVRRIVPLLDRSVEVLPRTPASWQIGAP